MILFGCQSSLCVVVELGEELPSPADIQLAHGRLRALCLGGDDKTWTHTTPEQTHIQTQAQKAKAYRECEQWGTHIFLWLYKLRSRQLYLFILLSHVKLTCHSDCWGVLNFLRNSCFLLWHLESSWKQALWDAPHCCSCHGGTHSTFHGLGKQRDDRSHGNLQPLALELKCWPISQKLSLPLSCTTMCKGHRLSRFTHLSALCFVFCGWVLPSSEDCPVKTDVLGQFTGRRLHNNYRENENKRCGLY